MPDETTTTELKQLDDEALFEASVRLRDLIAANPDNNADIKLELMDVEIERGMRRAASYPDGHPKKASVLAGLEKLKAEGFSDEVQQVGL